MYLSVLMVRMRRQHTAHVAPQVRRRRRSRGLQPPCAARPRAAATALPPWGSHRALAEGKLFQLHVRAVPVLVLLEGYATSRSVSEKP